MRRPIEIIADPSLHPIHNIQKQESVSSFRVSRGLMVRLR
jgi:hypothetical protein